jgi:hypothetical protein
MFQNVIAVGWFPLHMLLKLCGTILQLFLMVLNGLVADDCGSDFGQLRVSEYFHG